MGIKGIYNEIGPGDRIALSKLATEFFERKGRPLRLAIDISIWLFQIQAGEGGSNPALRTFYYRLLKLISLSIHPLFVFDGPNKPPMKRNKRTLPPGVKTASIPEFLAKQLLKHFALPIHHAPGEAEAECALLQRQDIVDAVLSEDADTLMFGSGLTLRNLSPEGSLKTKIATHVNVYEAEKVTLEAGLDREGMILVAMMSGGDYIPEGIPGCGPKTACQAARAGFGSELCKLRDSDHAGLDEWKKRLTHELRTNGSKFFTKKHTTLELPEDFPRLDVLRFYTHPCISSERRLNEEVRGKFEWDRSIDIKALRTFTGDAFEWLNVSGAKKFIRNLAPALLVRELRLRATSDSAVSDDPAEIAQQESQLIRGIHGSRNHVSTDCSTELRIAFIPMDIVPLDLSLEAPDPETTEDLFSDKENNVIDGDEENNGPSSPKKKRSPSTYDPLQVEKIWLLETVVKIGVPLKYQDWEECFRNAHKYEAMKAANRRKKKTTKDTSQASLDSFTRIVKPSAAEARTEEISEVSKKLDQRYKSRYKPALPAFRLPEPFEEMNVTNNNTTIVDLASSPEKPKPKRVFKKAYSHTPCPSSQRPEGELKTLDLATTRARTEERDPDLVVQDTYQAPNDASSTSHGRSALQRSKTISGTSNEKSTATTSANLDDATNFHRPPEASAPQEISKNARRFHIPSSPEHKCPATPSRKSKQFRGEIIDLCSSPSTPRLQQRSMTEWVTPHKLPFRPSPSISGLPRVKETEDDQSEPLEELCQPASPSRAKATSQVSTNQSRKHIRIRESLEGTWVLDDVPETDDSKSAPNQDQPGSKRKRLELRKSQVAIVDLTLV